MGWTGANARMEALGISGWSNFITPALSCLVGYYQAVHFYVLEEIYSAFTKLYLRVASITRILHKSEEQII